MNNNPSPAPTHSKPDALARLAAFRRVADDALRRRVPWLPLPARRELADEVIARVFALGRFDADESVDALRGFVRDVADKVSKEHRRKERSRREWVDFAHERPSNDDRPVDAASPCPRASPTVEPILAVAMESLPERHATLLRLRYVDDASFDEIAAAIGLHPRAASRLHEEILSGLRRSLRVKNAPR